MWSEAVPPEPAREPSKPAGPPTEILRHLRRAGKGEIVVAVPRSWVKANGLDVGGTLRLREAGPGRVLLEDTRVGSSPWSAQISCVGDEPLEHIFRCLVAGYLTGTPEIFLELPKSASPELRKTVREFARRSGRMEVVAETPTGVTLRDISGSQAQDAPSIVVRLARAVVQMQQRAGESLVAAPSSDEESFWEGQDDEVDRLEWRVHRALAAQAYRDPSSLIAPGGSSDALHLLAMARALERIGDHAVRIGRAAASVSNPSSLPPRFRAVIEYHQQVVQLLERTIPLIEEPIPRIANEIVDTAQSLHASHMALLQGLLTRRTPSSPVSPMTAAWLGLILDSVDRSAAYVSDIAELSLDRAAVGWVRTHLAGRPVPESTIPRGPTPPSPSSRKAGNNRP